MTHLRNITVLLTLPCLTVSCATALPKPWDCAMIGAAVGAVGGGAGAAEHAEDHDDGEAAGIGIASVVVGAALGYGVCALLGRGEAPEPPALPPPPRIAPGPPPPPPPAPLPAQPPPLDVCRVSAVLQGLNFASDSAALNAQARLIVEQVATNLARCPEKRIRIEAHTDGRGSDAYNVDLSRRRARSVRDQLVTLGISTMRLETLGLGESRPVADDSTAAGRALNRRVEVHPID